MKCRPKIQIDALHWKRSVVIICNPCRVFVYSWEQSFQSSSTVQTLIAVSLRLASIQSLAHHPRNSHYYAHWGPGWNGGTEVRVYVVEPCSSDAPRRVWSLLQCGGIEIKLARRWRLTAASLTLHHRYCTLTAAMQSVIIFCRILSTQSLKCLKIGPFLSTISIE